MSRSRSTTSTERRDPGLGRRTDPRGRTGSRRPRLGRRADGPGSRGPLRKQPDDEVFAGSTLRLGELHIEVTATRIADSARHTGPDHAGGDHATAWLANADPARRDVRRTDRGADHGHRRASDSWSATSRRPAPSCDPTTRPVQGWRSRSKPSRPSPFAFAMAS